MDIKRQQILEGAAQIFLIRGYQNASVQDIAKECNVSKATIYKCFPSKEDLGVAAASYFTEEMILQIEAVMSRKDLSGREKLRQSMILRSGTFTEKSRFIDILLFSFTIQHKKQYIPEINKTKCCIFNLFTKIIKEVYEIEDELVAAELAINVNGLMREISFIAADNKMKLDPGKIADFILDSLEALQKQRKGKPLLLTRQQLYRWKGDSEKTVLGDEFQRTELIGKLRQIVSRYESAGARDKLNDAIEQLSGELEKQKKYTIIAEALLIFLKQESLLKETVEALENLNG